MPRVAVNAADRFWPKVRKGEGCWEWMAYKNGCGYGVFNAGGKLALAHRFLYKTFIGPIPVGLCVLHHCDNPGCVNPDHLFLGTIGDNAGDRERKGRGNHKRGEAHARARLTEAQVLAIRADGRQQIEIAADYGMSKTQISSIRTGKAWRHLAASRQVETV